MMQITSDDEDENHGDVSSMPRVNGMGREPRDCRRFLNLDLDLLVQYPWKLKVNLWII